jgi:hypothetical protein
MTTIRQWFQNAFPRHRLTPDKNDVAALERQYLQIPQPIIESWIETILLSNPQSTDPNICIAWAARCDFVETIIKIRDRVGNSAKYEGMQQVPVAGEFDPRQRRVA